MEIKSQSTTENISEKVSILESGWSSEAQIRYEAQPVLTITLSEALPFWKCKILEIRNFGVSPIQKLENLEI